MKTPKQIQKEIDSLKIDLKDCEPKQVSSIYGKIRELEQYKHYLETGVTEGYLREQLKMFERKIERRYVGFKDFITPNGCTIPKKEYEKLMDYHGIKKSIKTLKYLLS